VLLAVWVGAALTCRAARASATAYQLVAAAAHLWGQGCACAPHKSSCRAMPFVLAPRPTPHTSPPNR
jgi:hypothetical protein